MVCRLADPCDRINAAGWVVLFVPATSILSPRIPAMLTLNTGSSRLCDRISRRSFVAGGGAGRTGRVAAAGSCRQAGERGRRRLGRELHSDLDPRRHQPSRHVRSQARCTGQRPRRVRRDRHGDSRASSSPKSARRSPRKPSALACLRGWNPKNGSHGTADQYVMSGRTVQSSGALSDVRLGRQPHARLQDGDAAVRAARHRDRPAVRRRQPGHSRAWNTARSRSPPIRAPNFTVRDISLRRASPPSGSTAARRCSPASTSCSGRATCSRRRSTRSTRTTRRPST